MPTMTSDAKRALAKAIRGLRSRLIDDLADATEQAYLLSIDAREAALDEASRVRRARLEGWIDEQARASGKGDSVARLRADVVKDAAATLLQRIVYLRLLEATGLRADKVVTGGWESKGYKDFREAAPELVRPGPSNETEGYATLLQLVFDELALDLPGLYGPVRMTSLVPVPASTLRAVVTALDDDELASVWTDDTTLGWIYQYWNDPEREALDAKLAASKKLENHEIASKTQMFTERYMVEWLLHNSLGQMWLAMCRKHGWVADVERDGVLDRLEQRRIAWRAKREAGEVALDALMPIEPGLEDRWKYWVPQPMPDDAVTSAPDSVRTLKLLDPACGSGHFLVIACELLFFLYQEEARHRGESWSDREIVDSILENNLHGIDIDPRAVQIAAATLMLKARQLCAEAEPRTLNLVAPSLSLASLAEDDPARMALCDAIERETGIPPTLTGQVLAALAGADHLGTLLKIDTEIETAIAAWDAQLAQPVADQGTLFDGFGPRRRKRITAEHAKATVLARLERFLGHHTGGSDLGLRLRGEQFAAGVRFVRMVRKGQYDVVIGNPPYQGTSKMADKAYVEAHYPRGKADLYAAFLERGLQLARTGGVSALLTMRNWMFIKQFSALREWLVEISDLRILGDVDRGAFEDVPDEVVAAVMSIFGNSGPSGLCSLAMQPTPLDDGTRDVERTKRKRAALVAQVGRFEFRQGALLSIESSPVVYWWTEEQRDWYRSAPKLGVVATVRQGLCTGNNTRVLRQPWELPYGRVTLNATGAIRDGWYAFLKGGEGRAWIEPLSLAIDWRFNGLGIKTLLVDGEPAARPQNEDWYFRRGIAFTTTGSVFRARMHKYPGIFGDKGRSVFPVDISICLASMNSARAQAVMRALNPTIDFTVGDVERLPLVTIDRAADVCSIIETEFSASESHREPSVEFRSPGPSSWTGVQEWAQRAIDRRDGEAIPTYEAKPVAESATDHLSFVIGVALGRFGAGGEGTLAVPPIGNRIRTS
jgi:hypothetical protein